MKKNILFVARTMGEGGTEKVVFQLCTALSNYFDKIVVASTGGCLVSKLESLGIKHYNIEDVGSKNLIIYNRIKKQIANIIQKENITILHTHHRMAAFICRNFSNVIKINNIHNTFDKNKMLTKLAFSKYNNIAVGDTVYENMIKINHINPKKITVINNSIECKFNNEIIEDFRIARKDKKIIIVFIGRLEKQKGVDILINSLNSSKYLQKKIKLFIYGTGMLEDELKKLANKSNDCIIFKGYTDNPLNIMKQSDWVVLPSRWEGLPLVIIEAFSVNKPIICSDISSNIEIVKDNFNGLTFTSENLESLKKTLEKLVNENDKYNFYALNAKKTYCENFSYQKFIDNYISLYKKTIKER